MIGHRMPGLRVLGLSVVAALALLAVAASAAQATGEFKIAGKTFAEQKIEEETFVGLTNGTNEILLEDLGFKFTCKEESISGGKILLAGILEATLLYKACTALELGTLKEFTKCTVDPIKFGISGEIILHGTGTYLLVKPLSGTVLMTILSLGAECSLPEKVEITGTAVLQFFKPSGAVKQFLSSVEKPEELFSKVIEGKTVKDGLLFGAHKVFLMSAMELELSGKFKGLEWSAV